VQPLLAILATEAPSPSTPSVVPSLVAS